MKTKIISIFLAISMIAVSGVFAGCSAPEETVPSAVCYAVAPTANSQGLNFNSPLVHDMAYDIIKDYGYISVVTIDGDPEVVAASSYDIPDQYKSASKEKLLSDANSKTSDFVKALKRVTADDPEVDYLEGLALAVRTLSSLEGYENKTIVVVGTGLSTTGVLNFCNNILTVEDVDQIVNMVAERHAIPNFEGMTVVWQQMGDVGEPQTELTYTQRARLQDIWRQIVERGGGEFVMNDIVPVEQDMTREYPRVSTVNLEADAPIVFDVVHEETFTDIPTYFDEPVMLTEEQVCFIPNEADYLNPSEAEAVIAPIAEYLNENPGVTLLLVGTTAGDETSAFSLELSGNRAVTVRNTLTSMGVSSDRLICVGMGSDDPWHVAGVGYDGAMASVNRKVVLIDATSSVAQSILANCN